MTDFKVTKNRIHYLLPQCRTIVRFTENIHSYGVRQQTTFSGLFNNKLNLSHCASTRTYAMQINSTPSGTLSSCTVTR